MPSYTLTVNGEPRSVESWDPDMPLLYALRNALGLHAAKFGCGLGQCACSGAVRTSWAGIRKARRSCSTCAPA